MSVQEQEAGAADQVTVDAGQLRHALAVLVHEPVTIREGSESGWVVLLDDQPLGAEGDSREAAIESMLDVLRLYSDMWQDLADSPDHRDNWGLAQLIVLSTDDQLRAWLLDQL